MRLDLQELVLAAIAKRIQAEIQLLSVTFEENSIEHWKCKRMCDNREITVIVAPGKRINNLDVRFKIGKRSKEGIVTVKIIDT